MDKNYTNDNYNTNIVTKLIITTTFAHCFPAILIYLRASNKISSSSCPSCNAASNAACTLRRAMPPLSYSDVVRSGISNSISTMLSLRYLGFLDCLRKVKKVGKQSVVENYKQRKNKKTLIILRGINLKDMIEKRTVKRRTNN